MKRFNLSFEGQAVALRYPERLQKDIAALFEGYESPKSRAQTTIHIREDGTPRRFLLQVNDHEPASQLDKETCLTLLLREVVNTLVSDLDSGVAVRSAAVSWRGEGILLPSAGGGRKSSLVAWLVGKGFDYLNDELAVLRADAPDFTAFARPLVVKSGMSIAPDDPGSVPGDGATWIGANIVRFPRNSRTGKVQHCRLAVFPRFEEGADLRIAPISAGQCAIDITACTGNARNLPDHGFGAITSFAREVPAVLLRYGSFDQLEGVLDTFLKLVAEGSADAPGLRRLLSAFGPSDIAGEEPTSGSASRPRQPDAEGEVEPTEAAPPVMHEAVAPDEHIAEEKGRFKLTAWTNWDDPDRGVARRYFVGGERVGDLCMSDDGVLIVDVHIPTELRRRRYYRRILVDCLKFYRAQKRQVEAVRGWFYESRDYPDGVSTNLTVFIDAYVKQQMTLEDAALAAPAGRNARAHGFSEPVVLEMSSKGWNPANDCPAEIKSLLVHYNDPEQTDTEGRGSQPDLEHRQNHSVLRQALHPIYLGQLETVAHASNGGLSKERRTADAPQSTLLNYELPDHLYGRFKSLGSCMIGSDFARDMSSRMVAHLVCRTDETVHQEADDGSDHTMLALLEDSSSAEGATLQLGDHTKDDSARAIHLHRGDVVAFPSGLPFTLKPPAEGECELIVIEWWSHGRNFINRRMTPKEFSAPLLVFANRQMGDQRRFE